MALNFTYAQLARGIISVKVTTANVDDKKPVPDMTDNLLGSLYGDKGYISSSFEKMIHYRRQSLIN
ncbi:transposase [Candidatus Enterovibrio escicola]|uniref:transposase n=1 Tax=Candidatus Enterovibrio escicola TaxID=1927127 RepID=UPI0012383774|nr:transposase [Candidatus Enterovibrio escacola]